MSRKVKSIDELREESEAATNIYKEHPSPYLHEKAIQAKRKLNNAVRAQLKPAPKEQIVKIQPLF